MEYFQVLGMFQLFLRLAVILGWIKGCRSYFPHTISGK